MNGQDVITRAHRKKTRIRNNLLLIFHNSLYLKLHGCVSSQSHEKGIAEQSLDARKVGRGQLSRRSRYVLRCGRTLSRRGTNLSRRWGFFQSGYLMNMSGYCDGVRSEPRSRQICLARRDNKQADITANERAEMRIEACRSAAGSLRGLVVTS